jgi:hypothetical protein
MSSTATADGPRSFGAFRCLGANPILLRSLVPSTVPSITDGSLGFAEAHPRSARAYPFQSSTQRTPQTHQYATRREFARTNNLPIFVGKDIADFIAYPNAHDVSLQRCFFQNVGVGQTVERNVFSLYFCGTTAGAFLPGRQKFVIGSAPPVHRSVGLLFVARRKFGGLLRRGRCHISTR